MFAHKRDVPVCAIDMGSNTFRRIVGTFDGEYLQSHLEERRLGVGDDLAKHGRISDAKLEEIERTLAEFTVACAHDGAAPVVAIGTAAFRDAPNAKVVIDAAAARGVRMEVGTEQRESELAYLVGSLGQEDVAVIDNGSRSIELVADQSGSLHHHVFNLGYRLAFEEYFARAGTAEEAVASFRTVLDQHAARAPFMRGRKRLVGVEFGEMAKVLFPGDDVEGRVFTRDELQQRLDAVSSLDAPGYEKLLKTDDIDRALPRLVVALWALDAFGYSELELTSRELGAGLIIEAGRR